MDARVCLTTPGDVRAACLRSPLPPSATASALHCRLIPLRPPRCAGAALAGAMLTAAATDATTVLPATATSVVVQVVTAAAAATAGHAPSGLGPLAN